MFLMGYMSEKTNDFKKVERSFFAPIDMGFVL